MTKVSRQSNLGKQLSTIKLNPDLPKLIERRPLDLYTPIQFEGRTFIPLMELAKKCESQNSRNGERKMTDKQFVKSIAPGIEIDCIKRFRRHEQTKQWKRCKKVFKKYNVNPPRLAKPRYKKSKNRYYRLFVTDENGEQIFWRNSTGKAIIVSTHSEVAAWKKAAGLIKKWSV